MRPCKTFVIDNLSMPSPPSAHVHVWHLDTTLFADVPPHVIVSDEERQKCARLRFAPDRRDYSLAHDLLRRCLSLQGGRAPADWRFITGAHGKPAIESTGKADHTLSFSVTHTRGMVACAIAAGRPVGIDVEQTDRLDGLQEIADRCFTREEAGYLRASPEHTRDIRFVELWTLKEAALKATGEGLSRPLDTVRFSVHHGNSLRFYGNEPRNWHFALFAPSPTKRLAVAIRAAFHPVFVARALVGEQQPDFSRQIQRPYLQCACRSRTIATASTR